MLKILVSNANIEENTMLCQFLTNEKDFEVENTKDSNTTVNTYFKIEPDIFILDSHFKEMCYTEIIDKISVLPSEKWKCNTILTLDKIDNQFFLENTAKIYRILYKPLILNKVSEVINLMKAELVAPKITMQEIKLLLLSLGFNINTKSAYYMACAIMQCYYYPSMLLSLNDICDVVALQLNTTAETIKEGLRSSLISLNKYGVSPTEDPLLSLLGFNRNITPRFFLEIITTYLHNQKNKK